MPPRGKAKQQAAPATNPKKRKLDEVMPSAQQMGPVDKRRKTNKVPVDPASISDQNSL